MSTVKNANSECNMPNLSCGKEIVILSESNNMPRYLTLVAGEEHFFQDTKKTQIP